MTKRKNRAPQIPAQPSRSGNSSPKGILELDRFTESTVAKWNERSQDLNELHDVLYFHLEPERRRHRFEILRAIQQTPPLSVNIDQWVRIIDYRWTLKPLSAAGSLTYIGGRFNAGRELNRNTLDPWPALYIAEDYPTAYREKFQLPISDTRDGLTTNDLALAGGKSHSTIILNGKLHRVFDLSVSSLEGVAKILRKIKMPQRAVQLRAKLNFQNNQQVMIRTGKQLFDSAVIHNWRVFPVQFGLPSSSQLLADLVRDAGFEGIIYPSTKGLGKCIALFMQNLDSKSWIELADTAVPDSAITRLDTNSVGTLSGWDDLGMVDPDYNL